MRPRAKREDDEADADEGGEVIETDDRMAEAREQALCEGGRRHAAHGMVGQGRRRGGKAGERQGKEAGLGQNRRGHRSLRRETLVRVWLSFHGRNRTTRVIRLRSPSAHPVRQTR